MRTLVVANPRSGSGKAGRLAELASVALAKAGLNPVRFDIGPGLDDSPLWDALAGAQALVVAGGDGTVRSVARHLTPDGPPLYHLPSGNENLFARQFGHRRDAKHLVRTVESGRRTLIDAGHCRWQSAQQETSCPFYLLVSIGPDAGVCHRLDASRTRATGHMAYTRPTIDEWANPTLPQLSVTCDGRAVLSGQRGMVVVANSRQYALRIDPCPQANPADGLLDVVFIPADTAVDVLTALARLRFGAEPSGAVRSRGSRVEIVVSGPQLAQADGESLAPPRGLTSLGACLSVGVTPRSVPVLQASAAD